MIEFRSYLNSILNDIISTLQELVRTFPTVTFHPPSQRLAVASGYATTTETSVSSPAGAVIVWDLRTATRVQVLDAHRGHPITAIAFSRPVGDSEQSQLVTYSAEEGVLKVWQAQTGLLSSLASTFAIAGSRLRQQQQQPQHGDEQHGVLASLAGGLKVVKSFPVERTPSSSRNNTEDWAAVLQHVKLEWTGETKVVLRRVPPLAALSFEW